LSGAQNSAVPPFLSGLWNGLTVSSWNDGLVPVTVLHDPGHPSMARIDRPVWNSDSCDGRNCRLLILGRSDCVPALCCVAPWILRWRGR
jgi:hypothetical protein